MFAEFQVTVVTALFLVCIPSIIHRSTRKVAIALICCWSLSEIVTRWYLGGSLFPFWGDFTTKSDVTLADYAPWQWFFIINAVTTVCILLNPHNRLGAVIGSLFCIQMLLDLGFGLAGNFGMVRTYLVWQTNIMWIQITILGLFSAGLFGGHLRRLLNPIDNRSNPPSVAK